jgi:hypothetical protein
MRTKIFIMIALRIILITAIGMAMTFAPEYLRGFFGDKIAKCESHSLIDDYWEWGARHYWYYWCCFSLVVLSIINSIASIANEINKTDKND